MKKIAAAAILTLISSVTLFFTSQPDGLLHVYFLNVGQGDSIFIKTPSGKNILMDGGPETKVLAELKEILPFFGNNFDYVLLSHPDKDHIEGLISVLKRYSVKRVIFTGAQKNSWFSRAFIKEIRDKNIPITIADEKADVILDDGVVLDVLFPFSQTISSNESSNDASMVVKIIYGENEILLTGDAEGGEEETLLNRGANVDSDILKVGHHGSKTSTSENFLHYVDPEYAVISVGKDNPYHHPHFSVLKRLKEHGVNIMRTDKDGRIEFILSKKGIAEIKTQSKRTMRAPSMRNFSSKRS